MSSPLDRMFTPGLQFDRVEKRWRRLAVHYVVSEDRGTRGYRKRRACCSTINADPYCSRSTAPICTAWHTRRRILQSTRQSGEAAMFRHLCPTIGGSLPTVAWNGAEVDAIRTGSVVRWASSRPSRRLSELPPGAEYFSDSGSRDPLRFE